ncbi:hypothetical protein C8Q75DRAFT_892590 [Abortiporus biennis]|nr:hypothetical protein C8Q75DRAFT_892590 [Abortiporus biennis]
MDYHNLSAERFSEPATENPYMSSYYDYSAPYLNQSEHHYHPAPLPAYNHQYAPYTAQDCGYSYYPSSASYDSINSHHAPAPTHIHAPIPVSPYSALLTGETPPSSMAYAPAHNQPYTSQQSASSNSQPRYDLGGSNNPLDMYATAPQVPFPTPADLLTARHVVPTATSPGSSSELEPESSCTKIEERRASLTQRYDRKPENQRKAQFRAVATNVGFEPTDPDTITSHDKKRHYLESLEKYVIWLHDYCQMVGVSPPSIEAERVTTYPGLDIRSIRTLLIHKQNETREINEDIRKKEEKFMRLQADFTSQQETISDINPAIVAADARRHSIASESIPALAAAAASRNL